MEAPPRFELRDQSFAVAFRGAIIVDIEPFLGVRQLKKSEKVGKYALNNYCTFAFLSLDGNPK